MVEIKVNTYKSLYKHLDKKEGKRGVCKLPRTRKKKSSNFENIKCIIDEAN